MICLFFCNESIANERRQSSAASAGCLSCKLAVKKRKRKHYAEVTTPRVNTTATVPHSRTAKGIKSNVYHLLLTGATSPAIPTKTAVRLVQGGKNENTS